MSREVSHFSKEFTEHADCKQKKNSKNVMVVTTTNADGYGNIFIALSVFQCPCYWVTTGANVYICIAISMFTSYIRSLGIHLS
jgi:hypothetical protein